MTPAELAHLDQATAQADRDATHTATGLGLLITIALALGIALTTAALWPGTWAATTGLFVGAGLIARVLHVALNGRTDQ